MRSNDDGDDAKNEYISIIDRTCMILPMSYYQKDAKELAPDLLGKVVCRKIDDDIIRKRVTETECYYGEEDTACHASHGRTKRSERLYDSGGLAYVHRCYMYNLLTIVTGPKDHPEGVLIRGVEGYDGPGKVGDLLNISPSVHGARLDGGSGLWFEDDGYKCEYTISKRIGIDSADEKDREVLWRFTLKGRT